MVQAFALNTIHVCREPGETKDGKVTKKPKIDVVLAGKIVDLTQDQYDEFEMAGAVRKASRAEVLAASEQEDARKTRRTSPSASGSSSTDPLDGMTKEQLLAEAEKRGVEVKPTQSKDEILAALKAAA
jgi:hypothetical protein